MCHSHGSKVTHLHELKVGKLEQRGKPMLKIKDHLIKTIKNNHTKEVQKKAIEKKKKAVEAYGNGTTGYRIKNGPNKGKILGHISTKANNNF